MHPAFSFSNFNGLPYGGIVLIETPIVRTIVIYIIYKGSCESRQCSHCVVKNIWEYFTMSRCRSLMVLSTPEDVSIHKAPLQVENTACLCQNPATIHGMDRR